MGSTVQIDIFLPSRLHTSAECGLALGKAFSMRYNWLDWTSSVQLYDL